MKQSPDDLLTCDEVAAELRCKPAHVWELIASGKLSALNITASRRRPPKRKNRPTWRVRRQAMAEYLAAVEMGEVPGATRRRPRAKHLRAVPDRIGAA